MSKKKKIILIISIAVALLLGLFLWWYFAVHSKGLNIVAGQGIVDTNPADNGHFNSDTNTWLYPGDAGYSSWDVMGNAV